MIIFYYTLNINISNGTWTWMMGSVICSFWVRISENFKVTRNQVNWRSQLSSVSYCTLGIHLLYTLFQGMDMSVHHIRKDLFLQEFHARINMEVDDICYWLDPFMEFGTHRMDYHVTHPLLQIFSFQGNITTPMILVFIHSRRSLIKVRAIWAGQIPLQYEIPIARKRCVENIAADNGADEKKKWPKGEWVLFGASLMVRFTDGGSAGYQRAIPHVRKVWLSHGMKIILRSTSRTPNGRLLMGLDIWGGMVYTHMSTYLQVAPSPVIIIFMRGQENFNNFCTNACRHPYSS